MPHTKTNAKAKRGCRECGSTCAVPGCAVCLGRRPCSKCEQAAQAREHERVVVSRTSWPTRMKKGGTSV